MIKHGNNGNSHFIYKDKRKYGISRKIFTIGQLTQKTNNFKR